MPRSSRFGIVIDPSVPRKIDGKSNPEWDRRYQLELKKLVLDLCGGPVCRHCGITDIEVLALDHINDDGAEERKAGQGRHTYLKILNGVLDFARFQVLCMNCNWKKQLRLWRTRRTDLDNKIESVLDLTC